MYDLAYRIFIFVVIAIIAVGLLSTSIYNAIQVNLLQKELQIVNKTWQNSNQSTLSALETNDVIKREYNKSFYQALRIINSDNGSGCLDKELPQGLRVALDLPPEKVTVDKIKVGKDENI